MSKHIRLQHGGIRCHLLYCKWIRSEQANDIRELKQQVAMGKGGVKVLLWIGGIVGAMLAAWQGLLDYWK